MKNKMGIFVTLALAMLFLASATIFAQPGRGGKTDLNEEENLNITPVEHPVSYEVLTEEHIEDREELLQWYKDNYKSRNINYKTVGSETYVLAGSGEKPTGGYTVEIESITMVSPGRVYITAKDLKPSPDMIVAQALTYPHMLIRLDDEEVTLVEGEIY